MAALQGKPLSAAATEAQIDATSNNPTMTGQRRVCHITLVTDGVDIDPSDIYDMLNTQYGTVGYEKDRVARGTYIFNIQA